MKVTEVKNVLQVSESLQESTTTFNQSLLHNSNISWCKIDSNISTIDASFGTPYTLHWERYEEERFADLQFPVTVTCRSNPNAYAHLRLNNIWTWILEFQVATKDPQLLRHN